MMRLKTLGDSSIEIGAHRIGPDSAVLFGFLIFLAVHRDRPMPRARLRELFWPGVNEPRASHSLRQLLYRLRGLGVGVLDTPGHITLPAAAVIADFTAFESRDSGAACDGRQPAGSFLPGYRPDFSEPFAAWVDEQRVIMHSRIRNTMLADMVLGRERGDWGTVEHLARGILGIDPLNEEATLSLAEATALAGSKVEAVDILDRYVEEIGREHATTLHLPPALLRRRIAESPHELRRAPVIEGVFVGRGESMGVLRRAVQSARGGRGESVFVWGQAGIGKTRLVDEFLRATSLLGVRSERITCQASDRQRPMSVFSELAQRLIDLPGALGCAPRSYDFLRRLCVPDRSGSPSEAASNADVLAANIRRALYDVLDAVSGERCLAIVIEDFHWIDEQSRLLLADMVKWARDKPITFILTSRSGDTGFEGDIIAHALAPLDPEAIRALVASLAAGSDRPSPEVVDRWARYCEGNPFYVREIVAHWRVTGDADSMPSSLSSLLSRRLAGLGEAAAMTLRAIAVLGRNCTADRLLDVLQYPHHVVLASLGELEDKGLVHGEERVIACCHDMVARASCEGGAPLTLRMLHRLAALALEEDSRAFSSAHMLWDCTRHWALAGEPGRGLELSIACSKQLIEMGLPREAAKLLAAARPLAATAEGLASLLNALTQALHHGGMWPELYSVLTERKSLASGTRSEHDDYELLLVEAAWLANNRDYDGMLSHAEACVHAVDAPLAHRVRAATQGIRIAAECYDSKRAHLLYTPIASLPSSIGIEPLLLAEIETIYHATFGDLDRAAKEARRFVSTSRKTGGPAAIAKALRFAAFAHRLSGDVNEAEEELLEALAIAESHRLTGAHTQATYRLAVHYLALGQPDRALERYASIALRDEVPLVSACITLLSVQALLASGRVESAKTAYMPIADFQVPEAMTRAANEFAAAKVRLQLEGYPTGVVTVDLTRLLQLHLKTRAMGGEDFAAGTLFRALSACGRNAQAIDLFHQYCGTFRRDRMAPANELADFASSIRKPVTAWDLNPSPA